MGLALDFIFYVMYMLALLAAALLLRVRYRTATKVIDDFFDYVNSISLVLSRVMLKLYKIDLFLGFIYSIH